MNVALASAWTDEENATLTRLWADGISASKIAAQMIGRTRNSIIGRVHRMKLSERARNHSEVARHSNKGRGFSLASSGKVIAARKARKRMRLPPTPVPVAIPQTILLAPASKPVKFGKIRPHRCHYIIGEADGLNTLMCAAPEDKLSLCSFHLARCWQAAPKRAPRNWQPSRAFA